MDAVQVLKDFLTKNQPLFTLDDIHRWESGTFKYNEYKLTITEQNTDPIKAQVIVGLTFEVMNNATSVFSYVRITGTRDSKTNTTSWEEPRLIK